MGQASGCAGLLRPKEDPLEAPDEKEKPKMRRRLSTVSNLVDTTGKDEATHAGYRDEGLTAEELKAKGDLRCGVRTRKGLVPGNPGKVNQDRYIVKWGMKENLGFLLFCIGLYRPKHNCLHSDLALFGAFDGHGPLGHAVSQYVATKLTKYLEDEELLVTKPKEAILNATAKLCAKLEAEAKQTCRFSGTTAVYGLKVGDMLYVANIGDSRCMMCTRVGSHTYSTIALSKDHKPEDPTERERILKAGGRVHPLKGIYGSAGPHRVWLGKQDLPGLAMSRSIGDSLAHTVGVTDIPDITEHKIFSS
eukprot:1394073-Amorphochlora_amoeboformis.AAC.1